VPATVTFDWLQQLRSATLMPEQHDSKSAQLRIYSNFMNIDFFTFSRRRQVRVRHRSDNVRV